MSDKSRKDDLIGLLEKRKNTKSEFERRLVDRTIHSIMRESVPIRSLREKLIMAIRNGDNRAIRRFEEELRILKTNETYGRY